MPFARQSLGLAIALFLSLAGCRPVEPIVEYTVARHQPAPTATGGPAAASNRPAQPSQTLGAIVLVDETGWFFKLTGDPGRVAPQREAFVAFLKTVKFEGGEPTWTLPDGWKQLPGREFRFATLEIPAATGQETRPATEEEKPLEITVIPLPKGSDVTEAGYLLSNINRWRDQVGLPPIAESDLKDHDSLETLNVDGNPVTLVDVVGTSKGGGMGGAPFAPFAGGSAGSRPGGSVPPPASAPAAADDLTYDRPDGWVAGRQDQFSKLAFTVSKDGQSVKITVTELGLGAGDITANVNRWRGQVNLPPLDAAELSKTLQPIETLGVEGHYVELVGPDGNDRQAMLGVIAPTSDRVWFIKLMGNHDLAQQEKANFEAFVKSLKVK